MTRRMLINAQGSEELRMAIASDSDLEHYQFDFADAGLTGDDSELRDLLDANE